MLKLLPLVYVAWADGKMSKCTEADSRLAVKRYELSAAGSALLESARASTNTRYIVEG